MELTPIHFQRFRASRSPEGQLSLRPLRSNDRSLFSGQGRAKHVPSPPTVVTHPPPSSPRRDGDAEATSATATAPLLRHNLCGKTRHQILPPHTHRTPSKTLNHGPSLLSANFHQFQTTMKMHLQTLQEPTKRASFSAPVGPASNSKAAFILGLNAELLKICMEFQSRTIPTDDQRYEQSVLLLLQDLSTKLTSALQSNLTWLAAAADAHHTQNRHPLPIMQRPVHLDSLNVSTERVRQLYEAMPAVFARDIARAKGQPIPPQSTPNLKRERPGDESDVVMKRRDTGESVAPQGAMPDRTRALQMRQQQQAQFQAQQSQVQQSQVQAGQQIPAPHGS
ncbi:hypothetical protein EI94DRAFT_1790660, partial [Lactarius quietus]